MNQRLKNAAHWLNDQNINLAFVNSTANVYYFSSFYCQPHERLLGLFLFPDKDPILVCPAMESSQARDAGWKYGIIDYNDSENPWEKVKSQLHEHNGNKADAIAIEREQLNYARSMELQSIYPEAEITDFEACANQLRVVKDEKELQILREAAELADFGVEVGISALAEGKSEVEIIAEIEYELKKKGVSGMSFSTMVLFGDKSALPHGKPGDRTLKSGDMVLFDLGVVYKGYCSDITRTVAYKSMNDNQKEIYNIVKDAQQKALDMSKPGTRIGDLDKVARDYITEKGYGEYFLHRIGHGLGIEVHEYPSMSDTNNEAMQEGMVYTLEPGVYVPGIGGVRIEDDVVVTKDGYETLTKFSKELLIIE
ncbi:Xaa-Pro peptidase family protein [Alkalihalobacillus sp. AL-G]|uniref:M24 family metallopeptidase n=1 Tax=Alkalihalobacillus sp. AL-G TaxID=2926399 RepID=UPI00272A0CD5|nr:Xaa-Pro peptidase family protein [Alkalihalobacillus sp. AL-G]WLD92365.1 Xaa-Pro peptidase family protein [Alkalihalobacillus sp. AL-G]